MDTICAHSTAPGRAGVAIIRMSGPESFVIAERVSGPLPRHGMHALRSIRRADGSVIDRGLVLRFDAPASFTGEDSIEFQIHGGAAVIRLTLEALVSAGARLAEAGEFTQRALGNDKMTLPEVEGLSDLLAAETEHQWQQAQRLISGELGGAVEKLRGGALRAIALLEASIDFSDEEVPDDLPDQVITVLEDTTGWIDAEITGAQIAERVRSGFEIAIVGPPNVGKSTLLNRIARREAAIVSEVAGTTRDVLEVRTDLKGLPVTWLDTAGLRLAEDAVEEIGVNRAVARAEAADLRVFLLADQGTSLPVSQKDGDITLVGKSDIQVGDISGLTGAGVDALMDRVCRELSQRVAKVGVAVNLRQRAGLQTARSAFMAACADLRSGRYAVELVAEEIRAGILALDSVMGRIDVEAVLGEIFSSFCIGK
ncbi:MAG: tRNA uridine-5-carboxymethylaminomethyl(34) synthesis GTPase MnmE [Pseudomonadota bacterium]